MILQKLLEAHVLLKIRSLVLNPLSLKPLRFICIHSFLRGTTLNHYGNRIYHLKVSKLRKSFQ